MISVETKGNCTIFKATGEVTANDILMQAAEYMAGEQTETTMWDFTQTARIKITTLEMKGIADSLKQSGKDDMVRKAALVGSKEINIGLGKLFAAFAQMAGLPYTYKVFRQKENAMAWLKEDS